MLAENTARILALLNGINDLPKDQSAEAYERGKTEGYADGRQQGYTEGEAKGYADGLAARSYETWTLTLADGSTVEKEVALL